MKGDFGPQKAGDAPFDLTLHTFESGLPDFGAFPDDPSPDPNDIAQASSGTGSRPAQMKVSDWNEVLVNNNLLNGFFIDQETEELFRARKTAFKLEPNPINSFLFSPGTLSSVLKSQIKAKAQKIVTELPLVSKVELDVRSPSLGSAMKVGLASDHDSTAGSDVGSDAGDQTSSQVSTVGSDPGDPSLPAGVPLDNLYPLWEICDDSRIRIQAISSQLQLASAQQGFSSADVKAAVDASTLSIGASASAGFATSSKSASSSTTGKATTQMHASYDFPRVRLFLDEDWISLSPDCTAALAGIKQIKSYKEVLEFYNAFGHLFVTRTKLGGCLRAIQHLTQAQQSAMGSTEDEFKASLAASFSTATASGSASSVVEKGSSSESKSASSNMNSSIAWEAQGGDTTLGNNPSLWCTTVDNSWFWRVVEQEAVAPIEYIISKIPGHEDTKALFAGILLNHLMETTPMEIPWNGASGVALGSGISSCCIVTEPSDILRQSALEVSAPVNKAISSTPDVHWHVVYDKLSMQSYLRQSFLQTVNALVGTRLYPNLVWRLGCSERAFSVVLTLRSGMHYLCD
ncbi:hypothetical protein FVEG_03497 [Fusarium verticillioides 7600]|uniref:MACPF-like domain-containing protein n=1 Tax=Gibberella moniliformis (strain M3125 / FGSC 7600) TaxID=334819 RepID=W7M8S4_GIBM7|nr:hypothetical protein FVEG_03497 [Fusarium verticillioides 7600]EWG41362.1 hypothetical protein FVEG_03497 [Fusarium verticillioides 7600]